MFHGGAKTKHLPHITDKDIYMDYITLKTRTIKKSGTIKLRFRLRDGRKVELYHKSGIEAKVSDLDRLTITGDKKKGVTALSRMLLDAIAEEKRFMRLAYDKMKNCGMDMKSAIFEAVIAALKNPLLQMSCRQPPIVARFRQYADDALRDRILGKRRHDHLLVVSDKLERFLTIKGLSRISTQEFTDSLLMEFRNFIFDEYKYVDKYEPLYRKVSPHNKPQKRLRLNSVTSQMKMLQAFFTEMESSDEILKSPFRRLGKGRKKMVMKTRYDAPVFLRSDEFQAILSAEVPATLQSTRDAFLLQCAFGCRISDFAGLSLDSISVSVDGIPYIHYIPRKTAAAQISNAEVETPIVRYAFEIISRSHLDFPILKNLYGPTGFNHKIKKLLEFCNISRDVAVYNEDSRQNDYLPLYKVASSKLARKTHVDMLNKVQINLYAAGLHKEGSAAVHRYTCMELQDRFALMNAAFGQKPYKVNSKFDIVEEG